MNTTELKIVVENANALFKQLKGKYPALAGHLVFSSPHGQCNLSAPVDLHEILKTFPVMIVDSRQKEKAIGIVQTIVSLEKDKKDNVDAKENIIEKMKQLKGELVQMIDALNLREDTFVEIRFDDKKVNLPLIFDLQKDELISRLHTPQTKASIRIVLGTLGELFNSAHNKLDRNY